jgi:ppGpp synthetase/RelA/SpoT-type nucleotidyltranferase
VAVHVPRFKKMHPKYEVYARFLEAVLKTGCLKLAPLAVVTARTKSIGSFAEKIIRKKKLYMDPTHPQPPDPLVRMTDLCGGRVIAQTAEQVHAICEFIERTFDIDKPNSEDVSQRLKPTEFGYRSVHYIVQVDPTKLKGAGVELRVPTGILGAVRPESPEPAGLKAEIQVRTLLEHAYADIAHDLIYKAEVKVPDRIRRQYAALAAVLEGADREFGRLLASLEEFKSNFGAWHRPNEVYDEINRLRIVLKCEPRNEELAIRIGQLALAIGEQQIALNVLKRFQISQHHGVQRVHGLALTELHWGSPFGKGFQDGMNLLEAACRHTPADAETLCALAECFAHRDEDERAGELFGKAVVVDPAEPLSFCRFLEFEVARHRNMDMVHIAEPMIRRVMEHCQKEIEGGVNLPIAWSCLGIFQLLLGEPFAALQSLTQVLTLCGKPTTEVPPSAQPCAAGRVLRRTQQTLQHLHCIRENLRGFDWFERLLLLGLVVLVKDEAANDELRRLASWGSGKPHLEKNDAVLILSGGCAPEVQEAVNTFRPQLQSAVKGLPLTLLSGGTRMGISGLAGDIAARSRGQIRGFGYLPNRLFAQADETRFAALFESKGKEFTPLDPLQGWTDLIAAGLDPRQVKLISYAGGHISRVEYAVALALGARVGIVESLAIPMERRFNDPLWNGHPNLLRLPLDAMTLRAFLELDAAMLKEVDKIRLKRAAQMAHAAYVKSARPNDPSVQDWKDLPESLKLSNFHQVAYWERVLHEHGLGVRKLAAGTKRRPLSMVAAVGRKGIRKLAKIEHGRWNVERLSYGWRYAEEKDVLKKLSPYLVPWNKVPRSIQEYDLVAIRELPTKLREAGLELYKLPKIKS